MTVLQSSSLLAGAVDPVPYDLRNLRPTGRTFNFNGTSPVSGFAKYREIHFYNNGLSALILYDRNIVRVSLTTAYDLSTLTFQQIAEGFTNARHFSVSANGTKILISDVLRIREYTLSTPYDLTTFSQVDNRSYSQIFGAGSYQSATIDNDGLRILVFDRDPDQLKMAVMSTAFDVSTATFTTTNVLSTPSSTDGAIFALNGFIFYVWEVFSNRIRPYATFPFPYNIAGASAQPIINYPVSPLSSSTIDSIVIAPNGTSAFFDHGQDKVFKYNLDMNFNISSNDTFDSQDKLGKLVSQPQNFQFIQGGLGLVVNDSEYFTLNQFSLTTAYDINTLSFVRESSFNVINQGIAFNSTGTRMYTLAGGNGVQQYNLSTANDISTAVASTTLQDQPGDLSNRGQVLMTDSDTKLFVSTNGLAPDGDVMRRYDLTTAGELSSASVNANFLTFTENGEHAGFVFSPNGLSLAAVGQLGLGEQYELTTSFDLSTATRVFRDNFFGITGEGLDFNADGTLAYVSFLRNMLFEYRT